MRITVSGLKIGLVASDNDETSLLVSLLENEQAEVTYNIPPSAITELHIASTDIHVWLLKVDDDSWHDAVDDLLDESEVPVFFSEPGTLEKQSHPEYWCRKLIERLFEITGLNSEAQSSVSENEVNEVEPVNQLDQEESARVETSTVETTNAVTTTTETTTAVTEVEPQETEETVSDPLEKSIDELAISSVDLPSDIAAELVSELEDLSPVLDEVPDVSQPETQHFDAETTEVNVLETNISETSISEADTPETGIPETNIPEPNIPEASDPETNTPDISTPNEVEPSILNAIELAEIELNEIESTEAGSSIELDTLDFSTDMGIDLDDEAIEEPTLIEGSPETEESPESDVALESDGVLKSDIAPESDAVPEEIEVSSETEISSETEVSLEIESSDEDNISSDIGIELLPDDQPNIDGLEANVDFSEDNSQEEINFESTIEGEHEFNISPLDFEHDIDENKQTLDVEANDSAQAIETTFQQGEAGLDFQENEQIPELSLELLEENETEVITGKAVFITEDDELANNEEKEQEENDASEENEFSLSLEPIEGEGPITGKANFLDDSFFEDDLPAEQSVEPSSNNHEAPQLDGIQEPIEESNDASELSLTLEEPSFDASEFNETEEVSTEESEPEPESELEASEAIDSASSIDVLEELDLSDVDNNTELAPDKIMELAQQAVSNNVDAISTDDELFVDEKEQVTDFSELNELKAESELEPEIEPETELEPEIESEPEAELELEIESEPETELEPEIEPEPEAELEPEIEPEPETELEPEIESESETELEPEIKPEPAAELALDEAISVEIPMLDETASDVEFESVTAKSEITTPTKKPCWVLGASLGGPAALKNFFKHLPADINASIIIAQHIDESFLPVLAEILTSSSHFDVSIATGSNEMTAGKVLLAPLDGKTVFLQDGSMLVDRAQKWSPPYLPCINDVIESVAQVYGEIAGAIIFSGMGEDGLNGAKKLRETGGQVWAQSIDTCANASMPESIINNNEADFIGTPKALAEKLVEVCNQQ